MLLHKLVDNDVNNVQCTPMNFVESTRVVGLTHHFYQKHRLNIILIIGLFISFCAQKAHVAKLAIYGVIFLQCL